jgi:hypothetical protein
MRVDLHGLKLVGCKYHSYEYGGEGGCGVRYEAYLIIQISIFLSGNKKYF